MSNVHIKEILKYDLEKIKNFIKDSWVKDEFWEILKAIKIVLIKPNLLGAFTPEKAVTTHPVVISAIVELLLELDKEVWIGDSPGGNVVMNKVWDKTGINNIVEKYKIKKIRFGEKVRKVNYEKYEFVLDDNFFKADIVIDVAKYKTHSMMLFTGAVKNLYGVVPGLLKSDYHKKCPTPEQFTDLLIGIYNVVKNKVGYSIIDGIIGMDGEGPSAGSPRNFGIMFAGKKASAVDWIAAKFMGFDSQKISLIRKSLIADSLNVNDIKIEKKWDNFKFKNINIGIVNKSNKILNLAPKWIIKIFKKQFIYYPDFKSNCVVCGICGRACPLKIIELKPNMKKPKIDYSKCIKCLCCHEMCPEHAIYLKRSWLARLILSHS